MNTITKHALLFSAAILTSSLLTGCHTIDKIDYNSPEYKAKREAVRAAEVEEKRRAREQGLSKWREHYSKLPPPLPGNLLSYAHATFDRGLYPPPALAFVKEMPENACIAETYLRADLVRARFEYNATPAQLKAEFARRKSEFGEEFEDLASRTMASIYTVDELRDENVAYDWRELDRTDIFSHTPGTRNNACFGISAVRERQRLEEQYYRAGEALGRAIIDAEITNRMIREEILRRRAGN